MGKKNLLSNYNEYYDKISAVPQQTDILKINYYLSLITHHEKKRILDIGSAEGELSIRLVKNGHDVTAADISKKCLEIVKCNARKNDVDLKLILCDIEKDNEPFNEERYDVIFLMDVIEHFRNPVAALNNIRELMNEESILIINTPNVLAIPRLLLYLFKRQQLINYFNPRNLVDMHFQTYDYMTLEKTLNFIGIRVIQLIPTTMTIPRIKKYGYNNFITRRFPFLSDSILIKCKLTNPINLDDQIDYWCKRKKR